MLPTDVQAIIRKPEKERTPAEQKIADDYFPVLRIDADKLEEVMPAAERRKYQDLQRQLNQVGGGDRGGGRSAEAGGVRRAAYMIHGYATSRDGVPNFLQAFDVDDGRAPCPLRTQTVTAPQGLFLMNCDEVDRASARFAERIRKESGSDLPAAVDLAYQVALARPPSPAEKDRALTYLANDPARLKNVAWLLFNLDEFI